MDIDAKTAAARRTASKSMLPRPKKRLSKPTTGEAAAVAAEPAPTDTRLPKPRMPSRLSTTAPKLARPPAAKPRMAQKRKTPTPAAGEPDAAPVAAKRTPRSAKKAKKVLAAAASPDAAAVATGKPDASPASATRTPRSVKKKAKGKVAALASPAAAAAAGEAPESPAPTTPLAEQAAEATPGKRKGRSGKTPKKGLPTQAAPESMRDDGNDGESAAHPSEPAAPPPTPDSRAGRADDPATTPGRKARSRKRTPSKLSQSALLESLRVHAVDDNSEDGRGRSESDAPTAAAETVSEAPATPTTLRQPEQAAEAGTPTTSGKKKRRKKTPKKLTDAQKEDAGNEGGVGEQPASTAVAPSAPTAPASTQDGDETTPGRRKRRSRTPKKQPEVGSEPVCDNGEGATNDEAEHGKPSPSPSTPTPQEDAADTPGKKRRKRTTKKQPQPASEPALGGDEAAQDNTAPVATTSGKNHRKKTPKKLPEPGPFDLRLPEPARDENDDDDDRQDGERGDPSSSPDVEAERADSGTPRVTFNQRMTQAKLRLLDSSPLNRLLSVDERRAAIAEAGHNDEGEDVQPDGDEFVPLVNGDEVMQEGGQQKTGGKNIKKGRRGVTKTRGAAKTGKQEEEEEEEDLSKRGVVYLGHIPHGFYEKEMRGFFSQFGEVTRVRLSRSRKTGRSRGYAFVEFAEREVAAIAAEAMDGYMMHKRILKAEVLPQDKVHPDTFKGCTRSFRPMPWSKIERERMATNAANPLKLAQRSRRITKSMACKRRSLAKLDLEYIFPTVRFAASPSGALRGGPEGGSEVLTVSA